MIRLRALLRLAAIGLLTFGGFASLVLIVPLRRLAPRWHLRLRNGVFRCWGRGMSRAAGMRVTVEGEPPAGDVFLVSNHLSYMDIVLLGSFVEVAFVAKSDLRAWPLAGTIIAVADTVFIDRSRRSDVVRVIAGIEHVLSRGIGVVVFAEGTTSNGERILPFKPSILELAIRAERAVHYATISYRMDSGAPAGEYVCWWGDAPLMPHLWRLVKEPGFEARLTFGPEAIVADDRKALARRLHDAMSADFEPVAQPTESRPRE